jgi:hypothetical protein
MKSQILFIASVLVSISAWSQENMVTLSGGYAFANVDEVDTDATGWRINGLYEFNPSQGKFAHGLSIGYIGTSADYSNRQSGTVNYKIHSWPIYYAPKFFLGTGSFKGFIKGALGLHYSRFTRTGGLLDELKTDDVGIYTGLGAGVMKIFSEKIFINLEYEWAYMSNSNYNNGMMNSAMLGVGLKF